MGSHRSCDVALLGWVGSHRSCDVALFGWVGSHRSCDVALLGCVGSHRSCDVALLRWVGSGFSISSQPQGAAVFSFRSQFNFSALFPLSVPAVYDLTFGFREGQPTLSGIINAEPCAIDILVRCAWVLRVC